MSFSSLFSNYKISFQNRFNEYDPYGIMRVNALQSIIVMIGILVVNGFYQLPSFSLALNLPVLALVIIGTVYGYFPRLKAIIVFCLSSIIYTVLFCFVKNYISLLVLVTGVVIACLFAFSRKFYPTFLNMIALVQVVASMFAQGTSSSDVYEIVRLVLDLISMTVLTIIFMYFFPKIYFFRVWKRALYLSIKELGEKFNSINLNQINTQHLLLVHLVRLFNLTDSLSYQENGLFARRIVLLLTEVYTSLAALASRTISIEPPELQTFVSLCNQFCHALTNNYPLYFVYTVESNNPHFLILQKNFNKTVQTWNKLCLTS